MAKHVEQQNFIEIKYACAARQVEEQKKKNREFIIKLIRYIKFLERNVFYTQPHKKELIELQVLMLSTHQDSLLDLIEAIDIWIERKHMCSIQESPYFSILADECQDISTQEGLSLSGRWLVSGKPEEQFITVIHDRSIGAGTITGQGYDGAATFAGKISGVQK